MKKSSILHLALAGCLIGWLTGCASTKVENRTQLVSGKLPRPATIWVYPFAATLSDLPAHSTLADQFTIDAVPQTPEQIVAGRELGNSIAAQWAEHIRSLRLAAQVAGRGAVPRTDDIVIRGYLVSVEPGNTTKRVAIGFGSGASELCAAVEGFQATPQGLRKLGYGTVQSNSGKSPGGALGVATFIATANPAGLIVSGGMKVYDEATGSSQIEGRAKATAKEIAAVLQKRFQEEGWID